ncbi:hypothetical protein A2U01_0110428, partial [Trifolium medium]|nr:hypothetical protein [Trifolium medium]
WNWEVVVRNCAEDWVLGLRENGMNPPLKGNE